MMRKSILTSLLQFQKIPRWLFRSSVMLGLLGILILGRESFRHSLFPHANELVSRLTNSYVLDPSAMHIYGGIILALLIFLFSFRTNSENRKSSFFSRFARFGKAVGLAIIFVTIIFLFEILIEHYWLKPTFHIPRPGSEYQLPEPPLTKLVENLLQNILGIDLEPAPRAPTSAPSGFVLRQFFLMLSIFVYLEVKLGTKKVRKLFSEREVRHIRLFTYVFSPTLVGWVSFSRIWRGAHTLFDIGISLGIGTLLFWTTFLFIIPLFQRIHSLASTSNGSVEATLTSYCTEFVFPAILILLLSFGLSGESMSWAFASGPILAIVGLGYILSY